MRKLTLRLLLFCLFAFGASVLRADEAPVSLEQFNQRLDRLHATLEEVEKALSAPVLTDGALRLLRDRIDPLPRELEETIDKLTPRLATIDARLKELAPAAEAKPPAPEKPPEQKPPPAPKGAEGKAGAKTPETKPGAGKAPPPPAAEANSAAAASVNAEIAEQRKLYEETDALLKRARALLLEARQSTIAIVARQRSLFAKTLFLRTSGLFSPALWRAAMIEAPGVARGAADFLQERGANFLGRVNSGRNVEFLLIVFLILISAPPAALMARRVLARNGGKPPTPVRRAAGAGWTALATAAVPLTAIGALGVALDSFDLIDATLEPIWRRIVEAVARIAFAYAFARAIFAPAHPQWRVIDPGDRLARRMVRSVTAAAVTLSVTRLLEQLEETVQASLPVVIVTRGLGVMIVAALVLGVVLALPRRASMEEGEAASTPEGRDWLSVARFVGVAVILLIVGACAAGYVTFANFVILQIGWVAAVAAALYVVVTLARGGAEAAFAPAGMVGRTLVNAVGLRREQLAPAGVLLSGVVTLLCYAVAALVALAPLGFESGDFLANLRAAFFSFKIGDVTISPSSAVTAITLFTFALVATHGLRRWLDTRFLPLTRLDLGLRNSISATLGYAGFILAAGVALSHLGLGFEKLAIVAGALSVGIGFGLQSIVNNFVSGLILLWERVIRVGDWVVIGDEQGYVKRINVRSTEIETFDRATMIVPNSNLVAGVVKNWLRGDKVGRIKIALSPHAGVDPEKMRDILLVAARAQEGVLRIPAPQVMFLGMEQNSFRFELWCYVDDVEQSSRVRSDLHFDLHKRLADAGVSIAAASSPPPPTIVQFPNLDKLAAAAAASAFAIEQAVTEQKPVEAAEDASKPTA